VRQTDVRLEDNPIFAGSFDSSESQLVLRAEGNAAYAEPGYLLFIRNRTLFAQRFDPKTLALSGEPSGVVYDAGSSVPEARGIFSATDTGVLAYSRSLLGQPK
jgi:hypothetical protein